jgi:hypothetical protein
MHIFEGLCNSTLVKCLFCESGSFAMIFRNGFSQCTNSGCYQLARTNGPSETMRKKYHVPKGAYPDSALHCDIIQFLTRLYFNYLMCVSVVFGQINNKIAK